MSKLREEVRRRIQNKVQKETLNDNIKSLNDPYYKPKKRQDIIADVVNQSFSGSQAYSGLDGYYSDSDTGEDQGVDSIITQNLVDDFPGKHEYVGKKSFKEQYNNSLAKMNGRGIASIPKNSPAGISSNVKGTPTIEISSEEELENVLKTLSAGDYPEKDKIIEILKDKSKRTFYIKAKNNKNFVVRVTKSKDGSLKVHRDGPYANGFKAYDQFFENIRNTLMVKFDVDTLVKLLKDGLREGPTYNMFTN